MAFRFFIFVILSFSLTFSQAKEKKEPAFIELKNSKIRSFSLKNVNIYTEAVFYNPYKVGVKLEEVLIDVFIGGKKMGTILNSEEGIKIKKKGTFEIPLLLNVKPGNTFTSFFSQSWNLVAGKKVELRYKGYIKVRALGFVPVKVKVDGREFYDWDDLFPDNNK